MRYELIVAEEYRFVAAVEALLEKGWKLHGSTLFVRMDGSDSIFAQALTIVADAP